MNDYTDNADEILAYLRNTMDSGQRQTFETRLQSEPELRQEMREIAEMDVGLQILAQVDADHADSLLLAEYAENRSRLPKDKLAKLEGHLLTCTSCRDELELCREALGHRTVARRVATASIWQRLRDWIFVRPLQLKPAYALATMVLLLAVGFFVGRGPESTLSLQQYSLVASNDRGAGIDNIVTLTDEVSLVELRFVEPVRQDCIYDFELYDSNNSLIHSKLGNEPEKVFAWFLPSYYLVPGDYSLHVIERDDQGRETTIPSRIAFKVEAAH